MANRSSRKVEVTQIKKRGGVSLPCTDSRLGIFICHGGPQLPYQVVALGKQSIHAALTFGNIGANVEFSVNAHVINGVQLDESALE